MALTAKKVYAILKRQISDMEAKLNSPVRYRGTVATADLLPLNPDIGDMYNIESKSIYGEAGMNVAWNGVVWDTMGAPIDMSLYIKSSELADWAKQPQKPDYTAEEVGALPANTKIPSKTSDLQNDSGFLTKIPDNYLSGTDKTLSASGKAADAKATGDKITELSADISNKLNKNQGSENSGKIAGINESGDIVPMFPVSVDYNEETNCLEFGSDQKMELNKGINLDSTLTKTGYAADAGAVGEITNSLKEDLGDIWVDKTVNIESDAKTYFFKFDVKSGETFIIQNNTNGWANISTKEQPLTSAPDVQLLANMKPNSTIEVVISDSAPYIRFYSSKAGMIYLTKKNTIVERIQTDVDKLKEQKTFICAKDGSGDFAKIVDAVNYINDNSVMDATLYIRDGIWDICSEYGTEIETINSKKRGLYLKNRIHIICSSRAVITGKYTGTNDTVREWFSVFNAGENGFILENAKIETDNVRYCVHVERDANSDSYINQYINCDMTHTNGFYVQCIGGGLGLNGHIIIDGCKFKGKVFNSQDTPLVSYHNSADGAWDNTESKGAKSFIDIKGCYLADKGTFNFINFGKSNKLTTVLLHDNSIGGSIQISNGSKFYQQNIEVLEWGNVNRNAN